MLSILEKAVKMLMSGDWPQGRNLEFWFCGIDFYGARAIAQALESGRCPQGLIFNLNGNKIGTEGAKAIAQALRSGQCPEGLVLNLGLNGIDNEGAKAFAQALETGQCPEGLVLNLIYNKIDTEGEKAIAQALRSGQCPFGLKIVGLGQSMEELCQKNDKRIKCNKKKLVAMYGLGFGLGRQEKDLICLITDLMPGNIITQKKETAEVYNQHIPTTFDQEATTSEQDQEDRKKGFGVNKC